MALPIRVGIVDDHPGVRVGIRNLLSYAKDILVVGEAGNGPEAIRLAKKEKPDILLLDVELPVIRGDIVMRQIKHDKINVKVLAVSSYNDPAYIQGMLENGAAGYITKEEAPNLLVEAVYSIVAKQLKWISPNVAKRSVSVKLEDKDFNGLELELLRYVLLDRVNEEIYKQLNLTELEVKTIIDDLKRKFEVTSLADLRNAGECVLSTAA